MEAAHVLLVGEADLSFARALSQQGAIKGHATATELGTPSEVRDRYFEGSDEALADRCDELSRHGNIDVVLGVDVTRLECDDTCHRWCPATRTFVPLPLWCSGIATPPASLVIFNFPHTTRPGKMAKLLLQFFRSLRVCIARGLAMPDCTVEMRLRIVGDGKAEGQLIRSRLGHEEAAAAYAFRLVSVGESDLATHRRFGYEHRSTKHNARCGHLSDAHVSVWVWQASTIGPPSVQRLPDGCRRDVFYRPEVLLDKKELEHESWKGPLSVTHYLVRWAGYPAAAECTWEPARDIDVGLRMAYDEIGECRAMCVAVGDEANAEFRFEQQAKE